MLENSFYTVEKTESTQDTYNVGVVLNASHEIYKYHFPENPITPGVCLLQMTLELLNSRFERSLRLIEVINPIENPKIDFLIHYKIKNDLIFTDINIVVGETVCTKINATYKGL
jgi:3-hydroxyacyl-[acyl-carrier-protein] dehydratase